MSSRSEVEKMSRTAFPVEGVDLSSRVRARARRTPPPPRFRFESNLTAPLSRVIPPSHNLLASTTPPEHSPRALPTLILDSTRNEGEGGSLGRGSSSRSRGVDVPRRRLYKGSRRSPFEATSTAKLGHCKDCGKPTTSHVGPSKLGVETYEPSPPKMEPDTTGTATFVLKVDPGVRVVETNEYQCHECFEKERARKEAKS